MITILCFVTTIIIKLKFNEEKRNKKRKKLKNYYCFSNKYFKF